MTAACIFHAVSRSSVLIWRFNALNSAGFILALNQFRVDPPGASGVSGFIVPDVVLFVNGLPLVVIEAKSPSVTDPIATAIDQMRRYANRRVPEKNEGAERLFAGHQHLDFRSRRRLKHQREVCLEGHERLDPVGMIAHLDRERDEGMPRPISRDFVRQHVIGESLAARDRNVAPPDA